MGVACGKIILFGEHAVVYGYPGIAVPVREVNISVIIKQADSFSYSADRKLYKEEKERLSKLLDFLFFKLNISRKNLEIIINSTIPIASGLGSSAALSISLIRAISKHFHLDLDNNKINKLGFECEKFFHGTPSGIDNTVITYEKPVYYKKGKTTLLKIKKPLSFVIADSCIKSSTKQVVSDVKKKYEKDKEKYANLFEKSGSIAEQAKTFLQEGNVTMLGILMTQNHYLLKQLCVSNDKLDTIVESALKAGAYGAKLVGAGKGGNIIAIVDDKVKEDVIKELKKASKNIICTVVE